MFFPMSGQDSRVNNDDFYANDYSGQEAVRVCKRMDGFGRHSVPPVHALLQFSQGIH